MGRPAGLSPVNVVLYGLRRTPTSYCREVAVTSISITRMRLHQFGKLEGAKNTPERRGAEIAVRLPQKRVSTAANDPDKKAK